MNSNDYMEDGQGRLVPKENIKELDLTRDSLVQHLVDNAMDLQKRMMDYKSMAMKETNAFVELSAMEYDVKLGGRKGNLTLYSFDTKRKVQVQVSEYLVFDEQLQVAKSMIDKCLNTWTEGSRTEIKTIINDAFQVDKEGRINTKRILELRRIKIEDALWLKAMDAITNSLKVVGSKSYFRVYERDTVDGPWRAIALDLAAL